MIVVVMLLHSELQNDTAAGEIGKPWRAAAGQIDHEGIPQAEMRSSQSLLECDSHARGLCATPP